MAIKGKEETWREFSSYPHSFCSGPGRDQQREEPGTREPTTTPAWLRGEKQRRDTEFENLQLFNLFIVCHYTCTSLYRSILFLMLSLSSGQQNDDTKQHTAHASTVGNIIDLCFLFIFVFLYFTWELNVNTHVCIYLKYVCMYDVVAGGSGECFTRTRKPAELWCRFLHSSVCVVSFDQRH